MEGSSRSVEFRRGAGQPLRPAIADTDQRAASFTDPVAPCRSFPGDNLPRRGGLARTALKAMARAGRIRGGGLVKHPVQVEKTGLRRGPAR